MKREYPLRLAKHLAKRLMGRNDPSWPLYDFEHHIHPETLAQHAAIRAWAETSLSRSEMLESADRYAASEDPLVTQGHQLKQQVESTFRNKRASSTSTRLLIHIPDPKVSPGGFSYFSNFAESFDFIGIPTHSLSWDDSTEAALRAFHPTTLLVTDHPLFLARIDWDAIAEYRKKSHLSVGLLAQLAEHGNTPLEERFTWAKAHQVDFYFSARDAEYLQTREEYRAFYDRGYSILTLPFGANPAHYYPVPDVERDLNYSFIASTNKTKAPVYASLAKKLVTRYPGFIDGYGWRHVTNFTFNKDRDRYIYARSKVGLNFHLPEQIEWACEVNERTHQLAMCGVPQLVDAPKLLSKLYSPEALFVCKTGDDFLATFEHIQREPSYGAKRALQAQREVFAQHTTLHRTDDFITQLLAFQTTR